MMRCEGRHVDVEDQRDAQEQAHLSFFASKNTPGASEIKVLKAKSIRFSSHLYQPSGCLKQIRSIPGHVVFRIGMHTVRFSITKLLEHVYIQKCQGCEGSYNN